MSNYPTNNRLPRHNAQLHGSSKSLWDVKSRLSEGPGRKFTSSLYASSVSLSPSGTNISALGAERRPQTSASKKTFPYGLSAKNRIRSLARFKFASSCDNVALTRHPNNDKDRRHTIYSPSRSGQRSTNGHLSSVPSESNLFINVRFNTLNCPQQSTKNQRSYSTSTLINPDRSHAVVGILGGRFSLLLGMVFDWFYTKIHMSLNWSLSNPARR